MNREPRILEPRRPIVSSFDPDADNRPARTRRAEPRWPVQQPVDALEAACRAGFDHFVRDPDPARRDRRYAGLAQKAKDERKAEFLAMLVAYKAAGGR